MVGRLAVLAVFVLGALWAPVIGNFKSLFLYLQLVSAYLVMPFVGVFFLGVLWKRINNMGVVASVVTGFIAGPILMFDSRMHFLPFMKHPLLRPWLNASIVEFLVCVAVLVVTSLLTPPPPKEKTESTTVAWGTLRERTDEKPVSPARDYRLWLAIVVATVVFLYWHFR